MSLWTEFWHNLTPGQGTLLGGAFVVLAGIIAFSTGGLDRRSQHKRFHYEEMKTLYAQALSVGRDLEVLKALPPEIRAEVLTDKADAIDRVISELALTGDYQTADLAIAYAYQQSVQLGEWVRQVETDGALTGRIQLWLDSMPEEQRAALKKYESVDSQSPRRGPGRTQRVGLVCAGGVTLPARAARNNQSSAVSS